MKSDKNSIERQDGRLSRLIAAAERGDAAAQCNLGICYCMGEGVKQDYVTGVEWLRKSAEQGYAEAPRLKRGRVSQVQPQ